MRVLPVFLVVVAELVFVLVVVVVVVFFLVVLLVAVLGVVLETAFLGMGDVPFTLMLSERPRPRPSSFFFFFSTVRIEAAVLILEAFMTG